jgi:hypothetical protein
VPSYARPGGFVVPGATTPGGDPLLARARLPLYDANILGQLGTNPMGTAISRLNPLFRIPVEMGLDMIPGTKGQQTETGPRAIFEGTRKANVLAQRLGLATEEPSGPRVSNLTGYLTEQVPMPTLLRSALTPAGDDAQMSMGTRLGLSALGTAPRAINQELRQQAQRERDRLERERRKRMGLSF